MKIFFAVLNERTIYAEAVDAREDIGAMAAAIGAKRIRLPYTRVDIARNKIAQAFMASTSDPQDVLVMLDTDHAHPPDVVSRLVAHDQFQDKDAAPEPIGVIGALCVRRTEPFDVQFYTRDEKGDLLQPVEWDPVVAKGTIVGTGAIAIRRWVFEALDKKAIEDGRAGAFPYFRMMYEDGAESFFGEDWYFALECEKAGIAHFVDLGLMSPHLTIAGLTPDHWHAYRQARPSILNEPADLFGGTGG